MNDLKHKIKELEKAIEDLQTTAKVTVDKMASQNEKLEQRIKDLEISYMLSGRHMTGRISAIVDKSNERITTRCDVELSRRVTANPDLKEIKF